MRFRVNPHSIVWPVWLNGWVFIYELSGYGFESSCCHLNCWFCTSFEQGVPWNSSNYRVWIHFETRAWHDKNMQSSTGRYETKASQSNWNPLAIVPLQNVKLSKRKKEGWFFKEKNCADIPIVRWNDNQVITLASNQSLSSLTSTCRRYSWVQRSRINFPQPHAVQKYNQYMGGIDQLDGFVNNMHPLTGGKKWYWMQMINLVQSLQVGSYHFYVNLG